MKPGIRTMRIFALFVLCVCPVYCRTINSANTLKTPSERTNVVNTTQAVPQRSQDQMTQTAVATSRSKTIVDESLSVTPSIAIKPWAKATQTKSIVPKPVSNLTVSPNKSSSGKQVTGSVSTHPNTSVSLSSPESTQKSPPVSVKTVSNKIGANFSSSSSKNVSTKSSGVSKDTQTGSSVTVVESTTILTTVETTVGSTEAAVEVTEPPVTEEVEIEETEPPTVTEAMQAMTVTEAPEIEEIEPTPSAEGQATEAPEVEETEPPTYGEGGAGVTEGSQSQGAGNTGEPGIPIKAEAQQAIADQNAKGNVKARPVSQSSNGQASEAAEVEEPEAAG